MRSIAIINQKGGCGKTTTAINLSTSLARRGRRTLLVDMDPQSHCAAGLGIPEQRIEMDIGDAMLAVDKRPLDPARLLWRAARQVDLAPSRMKLAGLEAARGGLAELPDREKRLALVLHHFRTDYDAVCIDCPPSIGLLTYNALAAADLVLIPVETSYFSLQGATKQVNTVKTLSRRLGVQLPVWILPTIHDADNAVAADLLDELHRRFKDRVAPVVIRRDQRLREAASFGQPAADYAPGSHGAEDYARLAAWIVDHLHMRSVIDVSSEPHTELDINVPPVSPRLVTDRHVATQVPSEAAPELEEAAMLVGDGAPELKPVSRAEDVARRAQEFLRRVALGRGTDAAPGVTAPNMTSGGAATQVMEPPAVTVVAPTRPLRLVEDEEVRSVSAAPSAARLLGVRETNQGVLFVQPLTSGHTICIAGSFNNWSGASHPMKKNPALGVFELCLKLPPGKVMYRLVIDGQWTADPHNNHCEPNPFGDANSVVQVGASRVEQPA